MSARLTTSAFPPDLGRDSKRSMLLSAESHNMHSTLHLAYSFACDLSCNHCIFRCGPAGGRTMGIPRAKRYIDQAGRAGIRRIVFTGGEPFLHRRDIRILIQHAARRGIDSALITNAAWASSRNQVREYLWDLQQKGLQSITLSTDRYHLLDVPLEKLKNVLTVAEEIGLRAGVKIARLAHDSVAASLYRSLRNQATKIHVQEISPLGRAAYLRSGLRLKRSTSFLRSGCFTPSVLLPNGDLMTCCNLPAQDMRHEDYPFILGSAERESIRFLLGKRSGDPILTLLRNRGPSLLLALLVHKEPGFRSQHQALYHSGCDLCFHLFCKLPDKYLLYAALREQTEEQNEKGGDPS